MEKANNGVQSELVTQSEDNGVQAAEKMFTQEEVNKIVSDRLAKERRRAAQAQQQEESERTAELAAKENRLICKEFLIDYSYPMALLDSIDTSDPKKFKEKASAIYDAVSNQMRRTQSTPGFSASDLGNGMAEAFERDVKHTPRKYY